MMKRLLTLACLALTITGAQAQNIVVSAATSLTNAFTEIGPLFEAQNPGVTVRFNFAGSGTLVQQISNGAPADVLATADTNTMTRAQNAKLIVAQTRMNFLENQLVLITPAASTLNINSLNDLTQTTVTRIAIGNPGTVPAGLYAKQSLETAQLWQTLSAKLITAQNVRQATLYVSQNEVDAGFVYSTDARLAGKAVKVAFTVNTPDAIIYPVARIARSSQPVIAQKFIQFLRGEQAQKVLTGYGFKSVAS
jgi:molybdate transport system substrate-binding protein